MADRKRWLILNKRQGHVYGTQRNITNLKHLLRELTMVSKSQTKRLTINFPNSNYLNGTIRTKWWASNPSWLTACYSREILGMLSVFPQPWRSMRSSCTLCTSGRYLLMCENTEQVLLQQITSQEGAAVGHHTPAWSQPPSGVHQSAEL